MDSAQRPPVLFFNPLGPRAVPAFRHSVWGNGRENDETEPLSPQSARIKTENENLQLEEEIRKLQEELRRLKSDIKDVKIEDIAASKTAHLFKKKEEENTTAPVYSSGQPELGIFARGRRRKAIHRIPLKKLLFSDEDDNPCKLQPDDPIIQHCSAEPNQFLSSGLLVTELENGMDNHFFSGNSLSPISCPRASEKSVETKTLDWMKEASICEYNKVAPAPPSPRCESYQLEPLRQSIARPLKSPIDTSSNLDEAMTLKFDQDTLTYLKQLEYLRLGSYQKHQSKTPVHYLPKKLEWPGSGGYSSNMQQEQVEMGLCYKGPMIKKMSGHQVVISQRPAEGKKKGKKVVNTESRGECQSTRQKDEGTKRTPIPKLKLEKIHRLQQFNSLVAQMDSTGNSLDEVLNNALKTVSEHSMAKRYSGSYESEGDSCNKDSEVVLDLNHSFSNDNTISKISPFAKSSPNLPVRPVSSHQGSSAAALSTNNVVLQGATNKKDLPPPRPKKSLTRPMQRRSAARRKASREADLVSNHQL